MGLLQNLFGTNNETDRAIRLLNKMHNFIDSKEYYGTQTYYDNQEIYGSPNIDFFDMVNYINTNLLQEGFNEEVLMDEEVAVRIFGFVSKLETIHG